MSQENSVVIRPATPADAALLFQLVMELAEYEKKAQSVTATQESLANWIFEKKAAEAVIVEQDKKPVGYMIYCQKFSSFSGSELYLEDLYIREGVRGQGIGKRCFRHLLDAAKKHGCARMQWTCLDWNKNSIAFYRSLGAVPVDEWIIFRLDEAAVEELDRKLP